MHCIDEPTCDYRREKNRLESFKKWPLSWISPSDLAADGFYYLGKKDSCRCVFCEGIITNWEKGDVVRDEHKCWYPDCPFINNENVSNTPLEHDIYPPDTINEHASEDSVNRQTSEDAMNDAVDANVNEDDSSDDSTVMSPTVIDDEGSEKDVRDESCRLRTFSNWPLDFILPSDLAADGFYYLGKQDLCRCAFCGQIVGAWEPNDTPRGEHKKFNSDCPFIKGQPVGNIPI